MNDFARWWSDSHNSFASTPSSEKPSDLSESDEGMLQDGIAVLFKPLCEGFHRAHAARTCLAQPLLGNRPANDVR
ncbi:hypothetical protein [Corallococcus sp. RDP092CA]|uniref:hypothetical protein n=1 Tax=Corallococcus sp. RDP092CA TaxID=3109369 RepID=UPI0035B0DFB5